MRRRRAGRPGSGRLPNAGVPGVIGGRVTVGAVMAPVVRAGGRADRRPAAAVLGRAFQVEPVYEWLLPDPAQRRRRLPVLIHSSLTHLHRGPGSLQVATVHGRLVGAAIW